MKIAIISDIHSNYQALKSVIEDCEKKGVEKIFCCGDIIGKGCNANKCVNLIRQKCEVVVRGNTDTRFTDDPEKFKDNPVEYNRIKNNQLLHTYFFYVTIIVIYEKEGFLWHTITIKARHSLSV